MYVHVPTEKEKRKKKRKTIVRLFKACFESGFFSILSHRDFTQNTTFKDSSCFIICRIIHTQATLCSSWPNTTLPSPLPQQDWFSIFLFYFYTTRLVMTALYSHETGKWSIARISCKKHGCPQTGLHIDRMYNTDNDDGLIYYNFLLIWECNTSCPGHLLLFAEAASPPPAQDLSLELSGTCGRFAQDEDNPPPF